MSDGFEQRALLVAESLLIDHWTAEVVTAMHAASVRPILLKGPAVARWLYADDPAARGYADIDLLVHPGQMERARIVLRQLGYVGPGLLWLEGDVADHDALWLRSGDGAQVDLHRTVHGCELLPDELVWTVLSATTETTTVGGADVTVLGLPARALHAVLHLEPRYGPGDQPWADLERALRVVDAGLWQEAAMLARTLGIEAEMGAKLRRLDAGAVVADELDLPTCQSARLAFRASTADQQVLARLAALPGWRAKLRYVGRKLLPPRSYLRQATPLVDRGALGIAAAYAYRVVLAGRVTAKALSGWMRRRD